MQIEAQRCGRLHTVKVHHLAAAERGEVAAFTNLVDQRTQNAVARAMKSVIAKQVFGQLSQAHARAVLPVVLAALQQASAFELLKHSVQCGLWNVGLFRQLL